MLQARAIGVPADLRGKASDQMRTQYFAHLVLTVLPQPHRLAGEWANTHGRNIILVVTSPGPSMDKSDAYFTSPLQRSSVQEAVAQEDDMRWFKSG